MTLTLAVVLWLLLATTLALVIGRGIRIADEGPRALPARLDPRAADTARVVAWLLTAALLVAVLLYVSTQDFIAAGGTP